MEGRNISGGVMLVAPSTQAPPLPPPLTPRLAGASSVAFVATTHSQAGEVNGGRQ
jgi:hypothetical protein